MEPLFSVIIPLYNKEKFIQNTLQSVLDQSFEDYEIIVVNDGSTDESKKIVEKCQDSRVRYFEKENGGVSSARNKGIELSEGKFIAFLDADDYWYPFFLEEIHTYICRFPEQKVFSTAIEFEYERKVSDAKYSIKKSGDYEIVNYFEASYKRTAICSSSGVFEKNIFKKVGLFDTSIKAGEDTDLWIRIGLNYDIVFIWKICVKYVYDTNSLSRNITKMKDKADFSKFIEFEFQNKALKRFLDYNRFSLAIKSKLCKDKESFNYFFQHIDLKNLPLKKRILLLLPAYTLNTLVSIKNALMKIGLTHSVFVK